MKIPLFIVVDDNDHKKCDSKCPFLGYGTCTLFDVNLNLPNSFEDSFERCDECLEMQKQ